MRKWNLIELMSNFQIEKKHYGIADNIELTYKGDFLPIRINGVVKSELKEFIGSYSIYDIDESEWFNEHKVEMLAIQEYSDSPYSIYINEDGVINSYECEKIQTIDIGTEIHLQVIENKVVAYKLLQQGKE